jgi:hypothetical protein
VAFDWKDSEIVGGLLFWELNRGSLSGISNARALTRGLTARSVDVTFTDTWHWLEKQPPQAEIRIGYGPKPDGSGFEPIELPWPAYLDREKELLAAWHASEQRRRT